jgi:hypothetical protein
MHYFVAKKCFVINLLFHTFKITYKASKSVHAERQEDHSPRTILRQ